MLHFELIGLNCRYSHSCLALFYLRQALEGSLPDSEAVIRQYTINDPYYDTLLRLSASDADVLFFSVYIWNALYIERLVRDLAAVQPTRPLVLGGPQAPVLKDLPAGACVVAGEIEGVGEGFYRDLAQGRLKSFYQAGPAAAFPFPYREEDFSAGLRNRQVYYESSRGCPFHCSYCLSSVRRHTCHKDSDEVKQELDLILAHGPRIIKFVDRTFNDLPERALALWQFLAERGGQTRCHFEIAPDRFSAEMFDCLAAVEPGRFQFEIGIQSTNPQTLEAISRQMNIDRAAGNIRKLAGFDNIHLHVDLILGLPHETEVSFHRSFNLVFGLGAHYIQMGLLKILPGTPISREMEKYGLICCHQPPYQVLASRWLDHLTLNRLYEFGECVEAFHNNRYFRTIWQYLRGTGEEGFLFFSRLAEICRQQHFFDRAATQELLSRMLWQLAEDRPDRNLLQELLCYDWLRCGHRFVPEFMDKEGFALLRSDLRRTLPPSMEGLYTARERSAFLKHGVFLELSAAALAEAGFGRLSEPAIVCFLSEQVGGVMRHSKVVLITLQQA